MRLEFLGGDGSGTTTGTENRGNRVVATTVEQPSCGLTCLGFWLGVSYLHTHRHRMGSCGPGPRTLVGAGDRTPVEKVTYGTMEYPMTTGMPGTVSLFFVLYRLYLYMRRLARGDSLNFVLTPSLEGVQFFRRLSVSPEPQLPGRYRCVFGRRYSSLRLVSFTAGLLPVSISRPAGVRSRHPYRWRPGSPGRHTGRSKGPPVPSGRGRGRVRSEPGVVPE